MPRIIRPKNWHDFQHYKERDPPWIKLHKRLLDDFEFNSLPVASRALAPMLWLLASEQPTGDIPAYTRKIAYRLRMTLEELAAAFQPLLNAGFFEIIGEDSEDASGALAEREPVATPETETQVTRIEPEAKTEKKRARPISEPLPDWLPLQAWDSFVEMRRMIRAPLTNNAIRLCMTDLEKLQASGQDPLAVLEQSVMRSWRGLFAIEVKNDRGRTGTQQQGRGTREAAEHSLAAIRRTEGGDAERGTLEPPDNPRAAIATPRATSDGGGVHPGDDQARRHLPVPDPDDGGKERSPSGVPRRLEASPALEIIQGVSAISAEYREIPSDPRPVAGVV